MLTFVSMTSSLFPNRHPDAYQDLPQSRHRKIKCHSSKCAAHHFVKESDLCEALYLEAVAMPAALKEEILGQGDAQRTLKDDIFLFNASKEKCC